MKDLFTICITHYNQMKYIFTAIDSVLKQDYPNIELIIADDGSKDFKREKVEEYIAKKKNSNIKNFVVISCENNVGTVKNMNRVLKIAKGTYISFFAADDALSNTKVISNYVKSFIKYDKDVITAQAYLYDNKLKKNNGPYVDVDKALNCNAMKPIDVFFYMAQSCFYASGATAYKMTVFKKYGLFDERYLLVEDWSYYLHLLKNNVQIFFVNFPVLNHRDGGVSHFYKITPTVKKYHEDIMEIYKNEILNDMPNISCKKKIELYDKCRKDIDYICYLIGSDKKNYYNSLIDKSIRKEPKVVCFKCLNRIYRKVFDFLKWHVYYKFKFLNRDYHIFVITSIYWMLINLLFLGNTYATANIDTKVIMLIGSLIFSAFSANLFVGIGDMMEYCVPLTVAFAYEFKVLNASNMLKLLLVLMLIYILVYYALYILRIIWVNINKKIRSNKKN